MYTRSTFRVSSIMMAALAVMFAAAVALAAVGAPQHEHPATGAHRHPEAAKMKNLVAADTQSIAEGQKLYDKSCASCHGPKGKGDGEMGEDMDPKPADLSDADWKHGSTDGEIFVVVRDGIRNTGMKSFG